MKRALQLSVGVAISVLAVWYSMRGVRVGEVFAALRHSNLLLFVVVMLVTLFGFWLRAMSRFCLSCAATLLIHVGGCVKG